MRIGTVGATGPDLFADNIGDALSRMGHVVTRLGSARPSFRRRIAGRSAMVVRQAIPYVDELLQKSIVRRASEFECEVVINVDANLTPSSVNALRRMGIAVAIWFPDCMLSLGRSIMLEAPYSALFFKEPHLVDRVRANLGLPAYYLPEACNPAVHRPMVEAATDPYLVIAGNMRPTRVLLLERLVSEGIPLKLYGPGFPNWLDAPLLRPIHMGRYLALEDKARVFRSAAGVLNTLHPAEVAGVNARLFEAAGSGAAVLTEYRPALPELFDIGREVLAFADFDELVGLARQLLGDKGLALRLGDSAARRAHRDHTYQLRLSCILDKIL